MKKPDDIGFMVRIMLTLMAVYAILFGWLCQCRADDAQAIANMIAKGQQVAPGYYSIASPIYIMNGVSLNWNSVTFFQQCPNAIVIDTVGEVDITGLTIVVQVSGGASITVQGGSQGSTFNRIRIISAYIGFNFLSATSWHIEECSLNEYTHYAIQIANEPTPDAGDSEISSSTLSTSKAAIGIYQVSGDGLRIENTKILGGLVAYQLQVATGALGDLFIVGCSIEDQIWGLLIFGPYSNVMIDSNEFIQTEYSIMAGGISGVCNGNVINCLNTGIALIGSSVLLGTNRITALIPIVQ